MATGEISHQPAYGDKCVLYYNKDKVPTPESDYVQYLGEYPMNKVKGLVAQLRLIWPYQFVAVMLDPISGKMIGEHIKL